VAVRGDPASTAPTEPDKKSDRRKKKGDAEERADEGRRAGGAGGGGLIHQRRRWRRRMNSMLWLRSLQEVFAPLRIFYVKDSQFIRSRGINTSSREPAARQGSGFRGESSEPYYLIRVMRPRRVSYPPLRRGAQTSAPPPAARCRGRGGGPPPGGGRRLPEATFCMGHGPMPRVASAFAMSACQGSLRLLCCGNLAESWPRAVRGRAGCRDAGMPDSRQPASVNLLRVSLPRRPAPSFPAPAGSRCPVGCRTCGQRACPSAPDAPGRPA